MSKEWMPPGGPFGDFGKSKKSKLKFILPVLLLLLALALFFILRKPAKDLSEDYLKALAENNYEDLMQQYMAAREIAFDSSSPKAAREDNQALMLSIENSIKERVESIIAKVKKGQPLSGEEENILSVTGTVSAELVTDFLEGQCNLYLQGKISSEKFVEQLNILQQSERLSLIIKPYASSISTLEEAKEQLLKAEAYIEESEWIRAHKIWDNLMQGEDVPPPLVSFIENRKLAIERPVYDDYHAKIEKYLEYGRYNSAYDALSEVIPLFPDDQEFLNWFSHTRDLIPTKQISWNKPVEHIAIRPVIIDTARAFDGDKYSAQADALMITADEFLSMLEQLRDNDFVLVPGDSFINSEGKYISFLVPEGKKPLILVIESFSYSPLRAESGTADYLDFTEEGKIAGVLVDPVSGELKIEESLSELGILNDFCRQHPDFSYNGAKATLSLTAYRGIFGYPYSRSSLSYYNEEREILGLESLQLTEEELKANQAKISALAKELKEVGYTLASSGWAGPNIMNSSIDEISADIKLWQNQVEPILGPVRVFHYPNGDHAQSDSVRLSLLTKAGFRILSGYGDRVYMVSGKNYVHTDKVYVGGDELRRPQRQNLMRFFDSASILSNKRP